MVIGAPWVVQMLDLGKVLGLSQLCKPLMAVTSSRLWVAANRVSSMVSGGGGVFLVSRLSSNSMSCSVWGELLVEGTFGVYHLVG